MKQETLEEAAEKYSKRSTVPVFQEAHKQDFIAGTKWQQKKMFTEEQLAIAMLDFGLYIAENRGKPIDTDNKIKEIIEQFKQQEQ
jgi:Zn-dependent oligopeptidase